MHVARLHGPEELCVTTRLLELQRVLQLDPNYPDLILVKRLSKAIDEIAKNEEIMQGIMSAAQETDDAQKAKMKDGGG